MQPKMQPVTLRIQLENEELLNETLRKAIEGAAKNAARTTFASEAEAEINRILEARVKQLTKRPAFGEDPSMLEKRIHNALDKEIEKRMEETGFTTRQIQEAASKYFGSATARIETAIHEKIENADTDAMIRNAARDAAISYMKATYPEEIARQAAQREIKELKERIAQLEEENNLLKSRPM